MYDLPLVDEVELIEANPQYAHIRYQNGRESTVSLRDLAPSSPASATDLARGDSPLQRDVIQIQIQNSKYFQL